MRDLIKLLRPHQWTKNLFIFMPLFFSLKLFEPNLFIRVFLAFFFFCLLSGAVYIYNDYHDIEDDRKHPKKRNRPLASGRVSLRTAFALMGSLIVVSMAAFFLFGITPFLLSLFYLFINWLYTIKLKHIAIVDIFTVGIGYAIRIFIGGSVAKITIYPWIVVMTFLLSLFLSLGKRKEDLALLKNTGQKTRQSLDGYTVEFIDLSMIIMASVTIVAYIIYTLSDEIMLKFNTQHLYLTSGFVLFGLLRYLQITVVEQKPSDPSEILLKDIFTQIAVLGWIASIAFLIYL
ncbi:MAG: decaprenyl-phosphate phosphoribosyltransferase [Deltaproteobacteria bacterium]|nr:decaprenyl-phosphate phosphoribosyltransferase [Deltaproteobacteria bacterium]